MDKPIIRTHADALIPKPFLALNLSILRSFVAILFLEISTRMFLATDVLQSIAIVLFVFLNAFNIFNIIYSQISKFEAPVMASVPDSPLKFVFSGKLKYN